MAAVAPARWTLAPTPHLDAFEGAPWPAVISLLLHRRGVRTVDEASTLMGEPGGPTDPALMPDLDRAAARIARACSAGERIAIIGDYDVDGLTSSTILSEALDQFGATVEVWLPDRFAGGYGPTTDAVRALHGRGASVLITVDCGTSASDELALGQSLGMDVIVLDHHDPPAHPPAVHALVNPKLPGAAYGSEPAACSIAYKVVRATHTRLQAAWPQAASHLALAALGTVCDMVPLTGEQRDLVRHGLPLLRGTARPGLRMLAQMAGFNIATADEMVCAWRIGPRLNTAGRLAHASLAFDLLRADDDDRARELAGELLQLDFQRRELTEQATALALAEVEASTDRPALAFIASPDIPAGVAGIVAARLTDALHVPAIVLHVDGEQAVGSARSVEGYDVTALMRRHEELFERCGGHAAAGGCTIRTDRLDEARRRLTADAEWTVAPKQRSSEIIAEAKLHPRELAGETGEWIERLGPFGPGHPRPILVARDTEIVSQRAVGRTNAHLAVSFGGGVRGIAFDAGHMAGDWGQATVVYRPIVDTYRGGMEAEILTIAPTQARKGATA